MSWDKKVQNYVKMHKVKTGFMVLFFGLTTYYDWYRWTANKFIHREKFRKKLRRWILGEDNLPPKSIQEF